MEDEASIVESSGNDFSRKDFKIMSAFAEFLEQKGYFVSEIEDVNGMHDSIGIYIYIDQETKDSYTCLVI